MYLLRFGSFQGPWEKLSEKEIEAYISKQVIVLKLTKIQSQLQNDLDLFATSSSHLNSSLLLSLVRVTEVEGFVDLI